MEQSIATTQIFNANCLEKMKDLDDKSVDLIFCDLPYGQTSCKWDSLIDLELFWKQVMRIKKLNTPIFFTTTTKFGISLIQSAPKKCFFRYDLVWVKSACCSFLLAKKMPMRKHEMIYVFYEKLPFYDLSSHKHKFIKDKQVIRTDEGCNGLYGKEEKKVFIYDENGKLRNSEPRYEPALPVSVVKEEGCYGEKVPNSEAKYGQKCAKQYDPPLPVSVVKEEYIQPDTYGKNSNKEYNSEFAKKNNYNKNQVLYDPPLPVSIVKEVEYKETTYGAITIPEIKERKNGESRYEPPLPVSVVKEEKYERKNSLYPNRSKNGETAKSYDPPLPTTMLEIKSTRGKHSTEKPVALMEWIFKYYSKEGDVILDPTMGSGSTGVACKNMNRNFIGIEMDEDIFKVAEERLK